MPYHPIIEEYAKKKNEHPASIKRAVEDGDVIMYIHGVPHFISDLMLSLFYTEDPDEHWYPSLKTVHQRMTFLSKNFPEHVTELENRVWIADYRHINDPYHPNNPNVSMKDIILVCISENTSRETIEQRFKSGLYGGEE